MLGRGGIIGAIQPLSFVAGGTVANGVSIPISSSAADVGDLIVVVCPHEGPGSFTLGGSGWTSSTYTWSALATTGTFAWKVLTSRTDITTSNNDQGAAYVIYRGVTTAAKVASGESSGTVSSVSVTFPSPAASCLGQLVVAHQQATTWSGSISGWTQRVLAGPGSGPIWIYAGDHLFTTVTGSVTVSGTSTNPVTTTYANAIELRR